jgi:hypothetical protein
MVVKMKTVAAGCVALLLPVQVQAGGAVCAVVDSIWQSGHSSAESTLNAGVNTMVSTFAANSTLTTSQIVSSIRVLTKQDSTEAEQRAVGTQQAMKAASETYVEQRAAEEIRDAYNTYGPPGQAVGACDVVADVARMQSAMTSVEERASEIVMGGGIDARAGSTVTVDEAIQKRTAVAAADFDAVTSAEAFFDPDTSSAVKDTYMNNLIGIPLEKPDDMNSVENGIQFMRARQAEAMRSPAIVSLAAVRAASEEAGHFDVDESHDHDGQSLQQTIDWLIDRYGGGDEYQDWSAELVTKSSTGVMKELGRLYAIRLAINNELNESADRRQVVIGSLLAGSISE